MNRFQAKMKAARATVTKSRADSKKLSLDADDMVGDAIATYFVAKAKAVYAALDEANLDFVETNEELMADLTAGFSEVADDLATDISDVETPEVKDEANVQAIKGAGTPAADLRDRLKKTGTND